MKTVGSYEAKTHLPRLLDEVARGARVTITKHGVPVAMLVPIPENRRANLDHTIRTLQEFRKGQRLDGLSVREMIEEGRRF